MRWLRLSEVNIVPSILQQSCWHTPTLICQRTCQTYILGQSPGQECEKFYSSATLDNMASFEPRSISSSCLNMISWVRVASSLQKGCCQWLLLVTNNSLCLKTSLWHLDNHARQVLDNTVAHKSFYHQGYQKEWCTSDVQWWTSW